jgi:isocitrate lyase
MCAPGSPKQLNPPCPRHETQYHPRLNYKFQFVTLAGFHALNFSMFSLAREYATRGMSAYADLQVRPRAMSCVLRV